MRLAGLLGRRQPVEALRLVDAAEASRFRCGRKWLTTKVRSSSGKPVLRRSGHTMARFSSLACQSNLWRRAERSWQASRPGLRHLRMGSRLSHRGARPARRSSHGSGRSRRARLGVYGPGGEWRASALPPGRMAAHTVEPPHIGSDRPTCRSPMTCRNQTARGELLAGHCCCCAAIGLGRAKRSSLLQHGSRASGVQHGGSCDGRRRLHRQPHGFGAARCRS
jgi:hypothetical protein